MITYRLDLTDFELDNLKELIEYAKKAKKEEEYLYFDDDLMKKINNPKKIKYSPRKTKSAEHATEARTAKAKEKIQNAINILRMEDKKLTHYSIAKMANVSYTTVKKYITIDEIK